MLCCLREIECAPLEVKKALRSAYMANINLSGINPFGNVEKDKALEETGVASTKQNASQMTVASLKKSFYTSGSMRNAYEWMRDAVRRNSREDFVTASNFEKRLSVGAYKMYQHRCWYIYVGQMIDLRSWVGSIAQWNYFLM